MRHRALWKLSVCASEQTEEAVAELLAARFGQAATIYTSLDTEKTTVSLYLERKPDWSKTAREDLLTALKDTQSYLADPLPLKVSLARLRSQDWAEAWKRHFKPLAIGRKLLIKPTWSKRRARAGQAMVRLDPGMSFGTGQHPTTSFCLRELARLREPRTEQSLLDIGTGSGILAICAAKMGYQPVRALELNADCLAIARANARSNRVTKQIRFRCQDVAKLPKRADRQYSVVCANLIANLLVAEKDRLAAMTQPRGHLVLAGILALEFPEVQAAYEGIGLRLARSRSEREWRSGCFIRTF